MSWRFSYDTEFHPFSLLSCTSLWNGNLLFAWPRQVDYKPQRLDLPPMASGSSNCHAAPGASSSRSDIELLLFGMISTAFSDKWKYQITGSEPQTKRSGCYPAWYHPKSVMKVIMLSCNHKVHRRPFSSLHEQRVLAGNKQLLVESLPGSWKRLFASADLAKDCHDANPEVATSDHDKNKL